nr:purine phosphorylase [Micromonospora sp. DSM 115978]
VPTATVRGISDRADGTKATTDGRGSQRLAARNAAAFAVALAAAADDDSENIDAARTGQPVPPAPTTVRNTVRGGRVGQQIGVVHGNVHSTWRGES